MGNQLTEKIVVRMRDADVQGNWKTSAILRQFQETAEDHSVRMGVSRSRLVEKGMCWVLYRQSLIRYDHMGLGDEITLTTWPGKVTGPFFPRYFALEKDGKLAGEAATMWVLFDIEKRRILRPNMLPCEYEPNLRPSGLAMPGGIKAGNMAPTEKRPVRYTDLDMNGHMNNARYADWACDILGGDGMEYMQINYVQEAVLGDEITLEKDEAGAIRGIRQDGKLIFEAYMGKQPEE